MALLGSYPLARRALPTGGLVLLCILLFASTARAVEADEYKVKGAFIFNFAKFVEWPTEDLVGDKNEVRVCVLGSDEVTSVLTEVMQGKSAGKRRVEVRSVEGLVDVGWCRIFFVTRFADVDAETVANSLGVASILTVGETDGFVDAGGIVNFVVEEKKIRFEINEGAAHRAGLKISSKLLRLAKVVVD